MQRLAELRAEKAMINGSIHLLELEIRRLLERKPCQDSLVVRLGKLREDNTVLIRELELYKHVDPRMVEQKRKEIITWRAEAERWNNNVAVLESWLHRAFDIDEQQIRFLRRSCYGTDHVDNGPLGEP